ncbi:ead/Ea22-like family protein [Enterobacter ludwigii]|uniref:ead/Ea22-like family protein n=1 Tax=Enterobacter ludwigii TaxID=299767 RepID=UPI0032AEB568
MSNIDKRALREAANAASAASWGNWESYKPHKGARGYEVKVGVKAVAQHCLKVDSEFIAAANPATVLALLDELEAKDKRIAELEAKLETADKLQDSSFRNGLQHGFSLGQTDNQAGFEQAIHAYGQQWKGE